MCNILIKYTTNNIFLTVLINKKKIYSKSTGSFSEYKKGKRKISNLAFFFLINNFLNFIFLNFKNKIFFLITSKIYGCTLKRFFFLKNNLKIFLSKIHFKYFIFFNKSLISFNGCKFKKRKRKRRKRKKNFKMIIIK